MPLTFNLKGEKEKPSWTSVTGSDPQLLPLDFDTRRRSVVVHVLENLFFFYFWQMQMLT